MDYRNTTNPNLAKDKNDNDKYDENQAQINAQSKKPIIALSQLEGNCAYFGFSDYYVIELEKQHPKSKGKKGVTKSRIYKNIESKLKIALLFFDKIIIHSADIIRDQEIYNIFKGYSKFIEGGIIEFLYSSSITSVDLSTIMAYVEKKDGDGEKGLSFFKNNPTFAQNVINLLSISKNIIHRQYGMPSKTRFLNLVKMDLQDVSTREYSKNGTMTLNQILYTANENKIIIPVEKANNFKEKIEDIDAGDKYSRQHILDDFDEIIGESGAIYATNSQKRNGNKSDNLNTAIFRRLIEERLCLLYANLNANMHFIIDFHNIREKYLPYRIDTFETYLGKLTKGKISGIQELSHTLIYNLRNSSEWNQFRADYYSSYLQWRSRQCTDVEKTNVGNISPINKVDNYEELSIMIKSGGK